MKKVMSVTAAALMLGGLTACGANDNQAMDTNNNSYRQVGFYSNENMRNDAQENRNGNGYTMNDNDGPVTEILDRNTTRTNRLTDNNRGSTLQENNNRNRANNNYKTGTNVGTNQTRNGAMGTNTGTGMNAGNTGSNSRTNTGTGMNIGNNDTNGGASNGLFSRGDANYHRHLNDNNTQGKSSYYNNYDGELNQRITKAAKNVDNVDDVRSVVNGNTILIAVDADEENADQIKRDVQKRVDTLTKGKEVRVVVDEGTFTRARNIDNDLRDGGAREQVDNDVRNLFEGLRDAVTPNNNR